MVEEFFKTSSPLPLEQRCPSNRTHVIPEKRSYIYTRSVANPNNINSAIEFYLQVGDVKDPQDRNRLALFQQIVNEPAFDQLRTKEQLGYIVFSGIRKQTGMAGYRIIIQSEKDPNHLESRIEVFIEALQTKLENMDSVEFEKHRSALCMKLLEKHKNLQQESTRMWNHIQSGYYDFDQHVQDHHLVNGLGLKDIQAFYHQFIKKSGLRRKLSVHLGSRKSPVPLTIKDNHVIQEHEILSVKTQLTLGKHASPVKPMTDFVFAKAHF